MYSTEQEQGTHPKVGSESTVVAPRKHALAVVALVVTFGGAIATLGVTGWISWPADAHQVRLDLLWAFAPLPFCALGLILMRRSRRYVTQSADELLATDPRAPVVYLRSFQNDPQAAKVDRGAVKLLRIFWPVVAYLVVREWTSESEEEYWSRALSRFGPVIAIGAPGRLPYPGAARLYVDEERWQEVVTDLVRRAALVVVFAGITEGLWWEVKHVAQEVSLQRLAFLLPNDRPLYEQFRDRFRREMNHDLGDLPVVSHRMTVAAVLRFPDDGDPEVRPVWGASSLSVEMALGAT